jgi:hypothetical protein
MMRRDGITNWRSIRIHSAVPESRGNVLNETNSDDTQDPERLTQTHLEQVNVNRPFRELASFFESIRYLHIVPQLVREPDRLADKMHNAEAILFDYRALGGRLWERLNGGADGTVLLLQRARRSVSKAMPGWRLRVRLSISASCSCFCRCMFRPKATALTARHTQRTRREGRAPCSTCSVASSSR